MNLPDIPLLDLLRQRMSWLGQRQSVLSQNVANADTPGYAAQDLKPLDFEKLVRHAGMPSEFSMSLKVTDPRHIAISATRPSGLDEVAAAVTEANPTGNTVSLQEEMIKVADTQAQYAAAANLYGKAVGLLRTAIGR